MKSDAETEKFVLGLLDPKDNMHAQRWSDVLTRSWNTLAHQPLPDIIEFVKEARENGVQFRDRDDTALAKKIQQFGK